MTQEQAISLVLTELARASEKHPVWPADRLRQVVVITEEAGEALKEALTIIETEEHLVRTCLPPKDPYDITLTYNKMAKLEENLEKEVVQTAAMAIRWLMNRRPLYASA